MFACCGIHSPPFLSEYLDKKRTGFRSSLITNFKVFAKDLPCVLTVRGVGRIGWQEGGKLVSVDRQAASRLLTLTTHISHLVPNNVHGVLSIVKFHRRQILL